jgi:predicted phosphodiesterase
VALLGLNSSWLAESDEDEARKLVIGERQTRAALRTAEEAGAEISVVLVHHPTEWIRGFDRSDSMALLLDQCDFVLHGHLHEPAATSISSPDTSALVIAAGACYETRHYSNSYSFVTLDLNARTGTIHFRSYSDKLGGFWAKDTHLYKNVPDGIFEFDLPRAIK